MHPRRLPKLASLPVPELLSSLAEGMAHIARNVEALEDDASKCSARGQAAIRAISDDEAGKFLIVVDAARCAYDTQAIKSRQLRRGHDHLAKGIYAKVTDMSPATYGEVVRYVDMLRQSYYLDGPNDVDWIFRNQIEARREETLYVDYVESDEGDSWVYPDRFELGFSNSYPSGAAELVGAMQRAGFCTTTGLTVVAEVWRSFVPEEDTHWAEAQKLNLETLDRLADEGAAQVHEGDLMRIARTWTFPLHTAELEPDAKTAAERSARLEELRRQRREYDFRALL